MKGIYFTFSSSPARPGSNGKQDGGRAGLFSSFQTRGRPAPSLPSMPRAFLTNFGSSSPFGRHFRVWKLPSRGRSRSRPRCRSLQPRWGREPPALEGSSSAGYIRRAGLRAGAPVVRLRAGGVGGFVRCKQGGGDVLRALPWARGAVRESRGAAGSAQRLIFSSFLLALRERKVAAPLLSGPRQWGGGYPAESSSSLGAWAAR